MIQGFAELGSGVGSVAWIAVNPDRQPQALNAPLVQA
jgi:hypothetical protein